MYDLFIKILTIAYGIGGIITILGYIPTMTDLWNKKPSANISTYVIWTITTMVATLYGFFILNNILFNVVVTLQLIALIIILTLRIGLKVRKN